jgi:rhodanese-related sulfurtransferase
MADRTPEISIGAYAAQRADGTTVDVRERMEFAHGHVPGAVWIPVEVGL